MNHPAFFVALRGEGGGKELVEDDKDQLEEDEDQWIYPWGFYYNWASDIFYGELEDFSYDPRDYLESMCWDPDEWLGKIKPDDVDYTEEQVTELAEILRKYFEKYLEREEPVDATMDTMDEDEVRDFIANTIAECIQSAEKLP
ncbi:hypothetical protein DMB44_04205 [Thermoplasma sp. Kam2015]|uniref:hypothetical protein n=1 Tax=Thermoplasma sp. Kam2015 TaxID=2094122 RepID=UPI000D854022|nr:hypothetical protein [Thermoplasma sp. Kam2015]PYB68543.1 hypothetical protein DMB44_04205 [Thermoplasma sp. Kam2015]